MPKIKRWRGGLKAANRRERDMTDGSFNEQYEIETRDSLAEDTVNWQIKADLQRHSLDSLRSEDTGYVEKVVVEDSVHSDDYFVENLDSGISYMRDDLVLPLIRSGFTETPSTTISNVNSKLDVYLDGPNSLRFIEPKGPPFRRPGLPVIEGETYFTDDWIFPTFEAVASSIFISNDLIFTVEGMPYRLSYGADPEGNDIWYESMSKFEWERIRNHPEEANRFTKAYPEVTPHVYEEPFFLDQGTPLYVRIQTLDPTLRLGSYVRDEFGDTVVGPHDGNLFLQATVAEVRDTTITDVVVSLLAHAEDIYYSEWALVSFDTPVPNTLHVKPWGILTLNEGTPLVFEN